MRRLQINLAAFLGLLHGRTWKDTNATLCRESWEMDSTLSDSNFSR